MSDDSTVPECPHCHLPVTDHLSDIFRKAEPREHTSRFIDCQQCSHPIVIERTMTIVYKAFKDPTQQKD
jgi:DNA-directed RNA polymerase subunit RPC12/RpoP